jgi:hypothetical protein
LKLVKVQNLTQIDKQNGALLVGNNYETRNTGLVFLLALDGKRKPH